jgi:two-component sensor histidine kinase
LGLIANELILNSLKHGLKAGTGDLKLTLKKTTQSGSAWAHLSVEDSGPGFPPGFDVSQVESMGYQLINLLIRQIRARLELRPGSQARVDIVFPVARS